jgi:hypothetical protein
MWLLVISGLLLVTALVVPIVLRPFNRLWFRVGLLLGRIVNPIVTSAIFFLVVTPTALLFKILGKDLLRLRLDKQASSYWLVRTPPGPAPETMPKQF